jgi:predicted nucleic acid-binding protein
MIILDSNIFIYLANGTLNGQITAREDIAHASISEIETMGFSHIHVDELILLEALFAESYNLALTDNVVKQATKLRQAEGMSLGDAIIAATALEYDCELWTANVNDFAHVDGLRVYDPLKTRK